MWRLNNMLVNNQWVNQRRNVFIPEDESKHKYTITKSMGCSQSGIKREIHSDTGLPQETIKISNKNSNLTPKGIRKRAKSKVSRRKDVKIRGKINELEGKKTIDLKKKEN